jgi:hypothetical protein
MEGSDRRGKLRSFAIGGVLGAAGAIAAVRRSRRRGRDKPGGLAAFEGAPCFLEHVGEEAYRHRGGDTPAGTSKPA